MTQQEEDRGAIDLREEWRGMQRRIVALLENGQKSDFADEVVELDARVYTDEARFDAEKERIFRREPLMVALSNELAEPGDRVLFDAAGPPILVVRGRDGVLRAFLNMCTHRGARLANWKLALDMGREVYHVPVVHRDTLSPNLHPHVAVFDCYGPHSRFSGAGRDFDALVGRPEEEWPEMSYQAVHYLFPNTTLSFTHLVDGETPVVTMSRVFPGASIGESSTLLAPGLLDSTLTPDRRN